MTEELIAKIKAEIITQLKRFKCQPDATIVAQSIMYPVINKYEDANDSILIAFDELRKDGYIRSDAGKDYVTDKFLQDFC